MYRRALNIILALLFAAMIATSCLTRRQLKALYAGQLDTVTFNMPARSVAPNTIASSNIKQDTIVIKDAQGNDVFLMDAVLDEESGEMKTGVYILNASVVQYKKVEIIGESEGYYIVAKNDISKEDHHEYLNINDIIILETKGMYDGRILKR